MAGNFDFTIENNEAFQKGLDRLGRETNDFRIPFRLISSDFYRSQRKLFTLTSEGLYPPLGGFNFNQVQANGLTRRQNAENRKERETGHPWAPILFGKTGDLKDSTLSPTHRYSLYFLGRQELNIGTSVPYGKFHQNDAPRTKLPQRKFVFIDGGPNDGSKDSAITGRRERWLNIINDHVIQLISGEVL